MDFRRFVQELSQEDRILLSRTEDAFAATNEKCIIKFSAFLDGRQQMLVQQAALKAGFESFLLFGGLPESERKILGCFPYYEDPEPNKFPIVPLTFTYRMVDSLTHRDFLGCFMALNLKRETIGDILVGEGRCIAFFLPQAAEIAEAEISKIGRVGVGVQKGIVGEPPALYHTQNKEGIVSSLRLDCLVALVCRVSREKAQQFIRSGLVMLCWQVCTDAAFTLEKGDIFSIRGFGKFRLEQIGVPTKKGRFHLIYSQYV